MTFSPSWVFSHFCSLVHGSFKSMSMEFPCPSLKSSRYFTTAIIKTENFYSSTQNRWSTCSTKSSPGASCERGHHVCSHQPKICPRKIGILSEKSFRTSTFKKRFCTSVLLKPVELKFVLQSIWQLSNLWKLTPFLKGYFEIHFSSEEDLKRV